MTGLQKDPVNRGDDISRTIPTSQWSLDDREYGFGDVPRGGITGVMLVAALPGQTDTAYLPRTREQQQYADHFAVVYSTMDAHDVWLLHARYYSGMSHAMIAESEGVTELTARRWVVKAEGAFKDAYLEHIEARMAGE